VSLARFGQDGSDVYVYDDVSGVIACCACQFAAFPKSYFTPTRVVLDRDWNPPSGSTGALTAQAQEMLAHLEQHLVAGHHVPPSVFDELKARLATPRSAP